MSVAKTEPGAALLDSLHKEIRSSLPLAQRSALDGFIRRKHDDLSAQLDRWILDDALKNSLAALPDEQLFGDDWTAMKSLLVPMLGNYWAMHTLLRRADARGPACRKQWREKLHSYSIQEWRTDDERDAVAALTKEPRSGWAPPAYSRATPVDTKTAEGRKTLTRRVKVALTRESVRAVPSLHREVGGTRQQVRTTLKRMARDGVVWSYTLQNFKTSGEALQGDFRLWDLADVRTELDPSEYDKLVFDALWQIDDQTPAQVWRRVGGSLLDVRASLDRMHKRLSASSRGRDDLWSVSVEEMLNTPGRRALYYALRWSLPDALKVEKALKDPRHEGWKGNATTATALERALHKLLDDEDAVGVDPGRRRHRYREGVERVRRALQFVDDVRIESVATLAPGRVGQGPSVCARLARHRLTNAAAQRAKQGRFSKSGGSPRSCDPR